MSSLRAVTRSLTTVLLAVVLLAVASIVSAQDDEPPAAKPVVEAAFGKGIMVRSPDDQASMNVRARIQLRATAIDGAGDAGSSTEIAIRRMRLVFQGNANGPRLTYYIQLSFSNLDTEADLRLPLRDVYVTWTPSTQAVLRVGQMKVPFSRQRVVSSSALQMVDRSIVVSELNLDRDVGAQLFSKDWLHLGKLGYALGVFGGEGRNRTGRAAGFLYSARIEAWPFGAFDDYIEGAVQRDPRFRLAVGANVAYNRNTNRPRSTIGTPYPAGDFDYRHASIDALLKQGGWSLTSELMYREADRDRQTVTLGGADQTLESRSGWGAYVQGGRQLTEHLELTGRYSHLFPLAGTDPALVEADEIGGGVSYYLSGHDLKVQGDYFSLSDTRNGRFSQFRVQMQLFF